MSKKFNVYGEPCLRIVDAETGEILRDEENISFEVHDMNAALYITVNGETTGPMVCYDNVLEEIARITGNDEYLDYVEYEDEEETEEKEMSIDEAKLTFEQMEEREKISVWNDYFSANLVGGNYIYQLTEVDLQSVFGSFEVLLDACWNAENTNEFCPNKMWFTYDGDNIKTSDYFDELVDEEDYDTEKFWEYVADYLQSK